MNEQEFARRVTVRLSTAAREIDDELGARLRTARETALRARSPARGMARFFDGRGVVRALLSSRARHAALAMAILAAVLAGDYWATWSRVDTLQEVDTALLIDDLPIDAYLDADFKVWLERDSRS